MGTFGAENNGVKTPAPLSGASTPPQQQDVRARRATRSPDAAAKTKKTDSASPLAKPQVLHLTSQTRGAGSQAANATFKWTPERDVWDGRYEFGGPVGAAAIMVFSHVLVYYMWVCVEFFGGSMVYPGHPALRGEGMLAAFARILGAHAVPSPGVFAAFVGFLAFEYVLAVALPGPIALGLPTPSEGGYVHRYKCNGVYSWYIILASLAALHFSGVFPLSTVGDYYGQFLTSAVLVADAASAALYAYGVLSGRAIRMSGNVVYDFFMGTVLNPKFPGGVCMKLFAEIRNSWVLTFVLALSSAARQYEATGAVSPNMVFVLTAYLLYVNACQKGEECITTTWDIHHEKFGWMLVYWNTCGVAFTYSLQALYLARVEPHFSYSWTTLAPMFALLFAAYFVWDTTNAQKNRFRMERVGVDPAIVRRRTFPQLPFGYIANPRVITSDRGTLFVDGWYRYARKLHYTMDVIMATLWASSCGFGSLIPWFYPCFFVGMILDREARDVERCKAKYGALWDEYVKLVPYKYIPFVY